MSEPPRSPHSILPGVYALGAFSPLGQFSTANTTVTAVVNGTELPVACAGLAPGYIGLYQANILIPGAIPPGLGVPLALKQGGQSSNAVALAIQ